MKAKLLNLGLLLSSFLGYLEWGTDQHGFLITMEWELFTKMVEDPFSVLHPLTILPLLGQLLLLFTLFQKEPSRKLTYLGMGCLALLLLMVLLVGLLALKIQIIASALPFLGISVWTILNYRVKKTSDDGNEK